MGEAKEDEVYVCEDIKVLEFPEAVRKRPGMYIGGTGDEAAKFWLFEVIANSVDQFLAGKASAITIKGRWPLFEVSDDGNGYPLEVERYAAMLKSLHFTATADDHGPHIHFSSAFGLGLSVVVALSRHFEITAYRDGWQWYQEFERGVPLNDPVAEKRSFQSGTRIKCEADTDIFTGSIRSWEIRETIRQHAPLFPGLLFRVAGDRICSKKGLFDLIEPEWDEFECPASFQFTLKDEFMICEVAAAGDAEGPGEETQMYAFVNGQRTYKPGSHDKGCLRAFKDFGWRPKRAALHVVMKEPKWAGPTTETLRCPKVFKRIRKGLKKELLKFNSH